MSTQNALPKDIAGNRIQAAETLDGVLNVTLNGSTYVAVTIPAGNACKSLVARTRSGNPWYLATSASPSTYYTCLGSIALDLVADGGETVFYALGSGADTLEVLLAN